MNAILKLNKKANATYYYLLNYRELKTAYRNSETLHAILKLTTSNPVISTNKCK